MRTIVNHPALVPPKDPVLALLLSLFPGGGQIYNGQLGKAVVVILTYPLSLVVAPWDAYLTAKQHNESLEMLESRGTLRLESESSPSPAAVTYRRLTPKPLERARRGNFYRAGLLAILGSLIAVSAATGGLSAPMILGATLAVASVSLAGATSRERRLLAERSLADARSELQALVIGLASQRRGRLTLGQVVEATKLGLVEAEELMESLALAGQVDFVVEEDGGMIYEFTDLLRLPQSTAADDSLEKAILQQARRAGGRLTLGELALEVGAPLRELQSCLTRLCADGFAREEETAGRTVYVFRDFLPAG